MLILYSCSLCDEMGAHELGGNLVLLDGDSSKDRIIVFCTDRSRGCCRTGKYILPKSYKEHFVDGEYYEYVEKAVANKKWVVARTKLVLSEEESYWIIGKNDVIRSLDCSSIACDSLVKNSIMGPFSFGVFEQKCQELSIELNIK